MKNRLIALILTVCMLFTVVGMTAAAEGAVEQTEVSEIVIEQPEEQPAEEQHAEEQPAEEQPAEEQPAEEQPFEEQPAEEQPAEEQPAAEQPAEEQPVEEQPVEEQPAEEQPFEEQPAEEQPAEEKAPLAMKVSASARSIFIGDTAVYNYDVCGGTEPYSVSFRVTFGGREFCTDAAQSASGAFSFVAEAQGDYVVTVSVTDAEKVEKKYSVYMPTAESCREGKYEWEQSLTDVELNGEWAHDILAVVESQLGYGESKTDFIVDEDGSRRGFTRYGAWASSRYGAWCGYFVSFCVRYAAIESEYFPTDNNCVFQKEQLQAISCYVDEEDEYIPQPGDLIFFNTVMDDCNIPTHIGFVYSYEDGIITTVEGNRSDRVEKFSYTPDDPQICGYGSIALLEARYESIIAEQTAETENETTPETENEALTPEIEAWIAETDPTEEMIARAVNAANLESIVPENGYMIYVRTGEPVALYDEETSYILDMDTRFPIACYSAEEDLLYALSDEEVLSYIEQHVTEEDM